jgi:hypothetical protein
MARKFGKLSNLYAARSWYRANHLWAEKYIKKEFYIHAEAVPTSEVRKAWKTKR